MTVTKYSVG